MLDIEQLKKVKVLCIGDVMLDRYLHSSVSRISPEGPVPVARVARTDNIAGGVANVARNVAALGAQAKVAGVIGKDKPGDDLESMLAGESNVQALFIACGTRPTTEKIRYVAQGQQLLRADREDATPLTPELEEALLAVVSQEIAGCDVVVLSDYAKGVLTKNVLARTIELARAKGVPVVVDPKSSDFTRYSGATVITPNAKETYEATGIEPKDDQQAELAGLKALQSCKADALLVTRAEQGMSLVQADKPAFHIRATAHEVFDVVGAGDTVVATLAVCLGSGLPLERAATLANMAAGIVVAKSGTATVSIYELMEEIRRQDMASDPQSSISNKIGNCSEITELSKQWKKQGLKVGFTNGCFDLLHVGHVSLLTFARAQCDRLVVGLNSDASVKRLKGPSRPVNSEQDRAYVLAALQSVDAVVVFDEDTPQELIETLVPDVLVKGSDYTIDQIVGARFVLDHGGQVRTFDLVPGRSSTRIIEKMQGQTPGC